MPNAPTVRDTLSEPDIVQQINNKLLAYDICRRQFTARPVVETYITMNNSTCSVTFYTNTVLLPFIARDHAHDKQWMKELIKLLHSLVDILCYIIQFRNQLAIENEDHSILTTYAAVRSFARSYASLRTTIESIKEQVRPCVQARELSSKWVNKYRDASRLYRQRRTL